MADPDQIPAPTLYPQLAEIQASLEAALDPIPVFVHADTSAVLAQLTPAVHLIPGTITLGDQLRRGRVISKIVFNQDWEVMTLVRDASDQRDMVAALETLGEIEASILTAIMSGMTVTGGLLALTSVPKPKTWSGGLVSGSIHFSLGWVFQP